MSVLDQFSLAGKVALVSGASKNIGLEITRAFAEAGATVIATARGAELLEQRCAEIGDATGARLVPIATDVTDRDSTDRLIETVRAEFDQLDILVNNAYVSGDTFGTPVFEIPDEPWEQTFAGNVMGPYRLCRGFGPNMVAGRGGSIINVLSGSGFQAVPGITPYGATKAALWMMTRYLAAEAGPKVRVNGLCPGITMSDTGGPTFDLDDSIQQLVSMVPLGRPGHPTEVAPAAVYLASDAARYTTGALLMVNGGRPW